MVTTRSLHAPHLNSFQKPIAKLIPLQHPAARRSTSAAAHPSGHTMSSQQATEMHRTDEFSGQPSGMARVISAVVPSDGAPQTPTHAHPSLEDIIHEADLPAPAAVTATTPFQAQAAEPLLPEPVSEEQEGRVLAGEMPITDIPTVPPDHHPDTPHAPPAKPTHPSARWPGVSLVSRVLAGSKALLVLLVRGIQRVILARRPTCDRDVVAYAAPSDRQPGSSTSAALGSASAAGAALSAPHQTSSSDDHTLVWWGSDPEATRSDALGPLGGLGLGVSLSRGAVSTDVPLQQEADALLHDTAEALRRVGSRARDALAQVHHVFSDPPDAAAELAGNMMGKPGYHHHSPAGGSPHLRPASPALHHTTGPAAHDATWADRLLLHFSHDGAMDGAAARAGVQAPTADDHVAVTVAAPDASPVRPATTGLPHASQALVEGFKTATHTFKSPHATAAEVAGRMVGKQNYGHR